MANYKNPYERSRYNRQQNWGDESEYRADRYGNRDQYDDYPRIGQRSRFGDKYDDYGYEASNFRERDQWRYYRPDTWSESGDRWSNMQHGYGSYSDEDEHYGTGHGGDHYGNYGGRGYRDSNFSGYRPDYGQKWRRHVFTPRENSYRGEFGDARDYMREGNYGNYNRSADQDNDRSFWDKTSDEVASWFGDEDAERRRNMDKVREGWHRGKGPKGYKRTDDRMREDINDRLSDDPWIDASDVEVAVSNGEVTLTGNVGERMAKRRAEDIAESVSGVANVENRIRVTNTGKQYRNSSFNTDL